MNGKIVFKVNGPYLTSLRCGDAEMLSGASPLFRMRMTAKDGTMREFDASSAGFVSVNNGEFVFDDLPVDVRVILRVESGEKLTVRVSVENRCDAAVEWIIPFPIRIPALCGDGGAEGSELLLPYNEGVVVSTLSKIPDLSPEYPSLGSYMMFPNMLFAQTASYLFHSDEADYLTVSAYDKDRAPKEITVRGGELVFKLFSGAGFGEDAVYDYPLVISCGKGSWHNAVEYYREFFENNLPPDVKKITENDSLPDWYTDDTLVLTYPVRGVHDMDKMDPNGFFPYTNALGAIDEAAKATEMRPLALLMHWEGTAPWAPPYVWPPYGGEKPFYEFRDELHKRGYMLGVYCSGFGYTEHSNLIEEYDNSEHIGRERLKAAMCAGADGVVLKSRICTGQRLGYDICPACEKGAEILNDAYSPLFASGIDYAQILDQNHGGGQYLCYSHNHGHPPVPGGWMTKNMQKLLRGWNERSPGMLLGCESAAAEPFIGELLMSDDRYELSTIMGRPVPLYAFLYHEYVKNFMGNQVCDPLPPTTDALAYRLAYSFAAGDVPTLVLTPEGGISPSWGTRDFSVTPDKKEIFAFLKTLAAARKNGLADHLDYGRMIPDPGVKCGTAPFGSGLPSVITTSWEYGGERITVLINPFTDDQTVSVGGKDIAVPARSVITLPCAAKKGD